MYVMNVGTLPEEENDLEGGSLAHLWEPWGPPRPVGAENAPHRGGHG